MTEPAASGDRVSVVIPTYHRPGPLRGAVASVLAQDIDGRDLEVIIVVSDDTSPTDQSAAQDLADDPRVRVVTATRPGPAAARNAGIAAAQGWQIAFMDDDCTAQPGWLRSGLIALNTADLVQGRTRAESEPGRFDRYVANDSISWLWEACNLFVRRDAVDRAGLFDEDFNPTGRPGHHFGEDVEWGWRLVRSGASFAYAPDAVVDHAVERRGYAEMLRRRLELRWFPLLLRHAPELRRKFAYGYFLSSRHGVVVAAAAAVSGGAGLRRIGARRAAVIATGAGLVLPLMWWRRARSTSELLRMVAATPELMVTDAVEVAALAYGSARYRRLLL